MAKSAQNSASAPQACPYIIKNTFIDVFGPSANCVPRRSASSPPVVRRESVEPEESDVEVWCLPSVPLVRSMSKVWSIASTSQLGDLEEIVSLTGESSDETVSVTGESSSAECISDNEPVSSASNLTLVDLVAPPQRAKLKTTAKAWSPNAPKASHLCVPSNVPSLQRQTASGLNMPPSVKNLFVEVVAAGQAALRACVCIQEIIHSENHMGWSLVGSIPPAHLGNAQGVLSAAKTAMLSAAPCSRVYVLGYERNPFAPSACGLGFCAQLALVEDECAACWDLLKTGFCRRGCACRWQHPKWQASVTLTLSTSR